MGTFLAQRTERTVGCDSGSSADRAALVPRGYRTLAALTNLRGAELLTTYVMALP